MSVTEPPGPAESWKYPRAWPSAPATGARPNWPVSGVVAAATPAGPATTMAVDAAAVRATAAAVSQRLCIERAPSLWGDTGWVRPPGSSRSGTDGDGEDGVVGA